MPRAIAVPSATGGALVAALSTFGPDTPAGASAHGIRQVSGRALRPGETRMIRVLVIGLALVASACTTIDLDDVWAKPGGTRQQATWDDWQCRREVHDRTPDTPDLYIGGVADAVRVYVEEHMRLATYKECMGGRGYERVAN